MFDQLIADIEFDENGTFGKYIGSIKLKIDSL